MYEVGGDLVSDGRNRINKSRVGRISAEKVDGDVSGVKRLDWKGG